MSEAALQPAHGRELYVRHARIDGRSVARLRAVDEGDRCVVEAEVWPSETAMSPVRAGPYAFPSPRRGDALRHSRGRGVHRARLRSRRLLKRRTTAILPVSRNRPPARFRRCLGKHSRELFDHVRPDATFSRPSSQSDRMPLAPAARAISSRLACWTASAAISSVMRRNWKIPTRPRYPVWLHRGQPFLR